MSNEVNQAYLRAYIKNRVANAKPQETSTPLPPKQTIQPSGQVENTFRRVDAGRPQVPSPRSSRIAGETSVAPRAQSATNAPAPAKPQSQLGRPELAGVWSPLGAERGMKGAGSFRAQPAVVLNGTPNPVAHAPAPVAREPIAEPANAPEYENPLLAKLPSARSASPLPNRVPSVRVDSAHFAQSPSHIRTPAYAPSSVEARAEAPKVAAPAPAQAAPSHTPPAEPAQRRHAALERELLLREARLRAHAAEASGNQARLRIDTPEETRRETRVPQIAPEATLNPSWEVDRLFWPEVLYQLEQSDQNAFELIGSHLKSANQDGLKVMAVTSGERGVGRSTVAMHLARAAANAGLRVALVDADAGYPSLIDQLRLDMEHGWQDCLFENVPLEEVSVRSVQDNITVFPLTSVIAPQQLHANLARIGKIIKRIAATHDVVFLDSIRLNLEQRDLVGVSQECVIDAAIVVVDTELSIKEKVDTAVGILQGMGVASIGMVENFHA